VVRSSREPRSTLPRPVRWARSLVRVLAACLRVVFTDDHVGSESVKTSCNIFQKICLGLTAPQRLPFGCDGRPAATVHKRICSTPHLAHSSLTENTELSSRILRRKVARPGLDQRSRNSAAMFEPISSNGTVTFGTRNKVGALADLRCS
jgi:hypothetical protein